MLSDDKHCEGLTQEQVERIAVAYFGGEVHREWCVAAINKALCEDHGHSNGRIRASHKHLAAAIRALNNSSDGGKQT